MPEKKDEKRAKPAEVKITPEQKAKEEAARKAKADAEAKAAAELKVQEDAGAAHQKVLNKKGAMLCPDCNGLGFTRPEGKQVFCDTCKGTGSIPLPDGALKVAEEGKVPVMAARIEHQNLHPADLSEKMCQAGEPYLVKLVALKVPRKRARQLLGLPPEQEAPKA